MQSGRLTEELAEDLRMVRRDLDELSLNVRRDLSAMQKEITEVRAQMQKLTEEHKVQLSSLADTQREAAKTHAEFSKVLSEMKLAGSRFEQKFQDVVHRDLKQYLGELKQNLTGFQDISKETPLIAKQLKDAKMHLDTFTAVAKKIQMKDLELVKFAKEVERINKEKLGLLRKVDFLEKLIAKERRGR